MTNSRSSSIVGLGLDFLLQTNTPPDKPVQNLIRYEKEKWTLTNSLECNSDFLSICIFISSIKVAQKRGLLRLDIQDKQLILDKIPEKENVENIT